MASCGEFFFSSGESYNYRIAQTFDRFWTNVKTLEGTLLSWSKESEVILGLWQEYRSPGLRTNYADYTGICASIPRMIYIEDSAPFLLHCREAEDTR